MTEILEQGLKVTSISERVVRGEAIVALDSWHSQMLAVARAVNDDVLASTAFYAYGAVRGHVVRGELSAQNAITAAECLTAHYLSDAGRLDTPEGRIAAGVVELLG
jgi:hypothetical protein